MTHHPRSGKITLVALVFLLFIVVLAGLLGNIGHTVNQKMEVQNAADAVAFSRAMWMARGMNTITASNHLIGEATALCVIQESLGGPELRLGLRTNTPENQLLDGVIRSAADFAPIGQIPSVYVPPPLTTLDHRVIDFLVRRTSPDGADPLTAFGTLYDARMTLKRELTAWLIAKSLSNLAFLVPPPFGYPPAVIAYGVHIVATSQIVLIGKEWLILEVVQRYAAAAAPVHDRVIEAELIPLLAEFAAGTTGLELGSESRSQEDGYLVRNAVRAAESLTQQHRVEAAPYPAADELRLPVEFEPAPSAAAWQGTFPRGWGEDSWLPIPDASQALDRMNNQLDDVLDQLDQSLDRIARNVGELSDLRQELNDRQNASDVSGPALDDFQVERRRLDADIARLQSDAAEIRNQRQEIRARRNTLQQGLSAIGVGQSQNLSLQHVPETMNPVEERLTQWARATAPNVDALRAPILGLMQQQLPKSHAAEHFTKWTNRYTLIKSWQFRSGQRLQPTGSDAAEWQDEMEPLALLVMDDSFQGRRPRKGQEPWTQNSDSARQSAEELFTYVCAAHREFSPLFSSIIYPSAQEHGLTAFSQSILYNANPQRPNSGSLDRQAPIGWDTLNWDPDGPPASEWGADATVQALRWPWELLSGVPDPPRVKLNWQPKTIPLTPSRLQQASDHLRSELGSEAGQAVDLALDFPELLTH